MDRLKEYLPEACYEPKNMSAEDVKLAYLKKETVVGMFQKNKSFGFVLW